MKSDWQRFGDPDGFEIAVRWTDDPDPAERRPSGHGWSMGQFELTVGRQLLTESTVQDSRQSSVTWYLAPIFDWLATNWVCLLHEEHFVWTDHTGSPAAAACRHALDHWRRTRDPMGRETYRQIQTWYHRHGLRSAAPGGVTPDVFIRRFGDEIELSWTDDPPPFSRDGLIFESRGGYLRLPVAEVAQPLLDLLQWLTESTTGLSAQYQEYWESLCGKIADIRQLDAATFDRAYVPDHVLAPARDAFEKIDRLDLLVGRRSSNEPYVREFPAAVAMFGGVSAALALPDIERLRDALVKGFPGGDCAELSELVDARVGLPLGTPHVDGDWFASDFLSDLDVLDNDEFIDVRRLCARLEIAVREVRLTTDSIRGVALAGEGLSPSIVINLTHPFNRTETGKRFTIGHELCHVLFDRSRARRLTHLSGSWAPWGIEQRANAFAAYLLMPRELVMEHISPSSPASAEEIRRLAGVLRVSESSLIEHLYNLDLIDEVERENLRFGPRRRH